MKNKLERFGKLATQYEEAETLLEMIEEENDPAPGRRGWRPLRGVEKVHRRAAAHDDAERRVRPQQRHPDLPRRHPVDRRLRTGPKCLYRMYTRWAEGPWVQR